MPDIQCFKYVTLPKQGNCTIKTLVQKWIKRSFVLSEQQCSWYSNLAMGWELQGSNPFKDKRFVSFLKCPDLLWGLPSLLFHGYGGSLLGVQRQECTVNHTVPSSAEVLSGSIPLFHLYAFMAFDRKKLYSFISTFVLTKHNLLANSHFPYLGLEDIHLTDFWVCPKTRDSILNIFSDVKIELIPGTACVCVSLSFSFPISQNCSTGTVCMNDAEQQICATLKELQWQNSEWSSLVPIYDGKQKHTHIKKVFMPTSATWCENRCEKKTDIVGRILLWFRLVPKLWFKDLHAVSTIMQGVL